MEVWNKISDDHLGYEASSLGRIRSVDRDVKSPHGGVMRRKGVILKQRKNHNGYMIVNLSLNSLHRTFSVHRLVCMAFNGNPPSEAHHAAHGDGDCTNNSSQNLRWATVHENKNDQLIHGTRIMGEKQSSAKLTKEQVIFIRNSSIPHRKLSLMFGVGSTQIGRIKRREKWAHLKDS